MEPSPNKFKSKIDKIFKKFPHFGKLLSSLFGLFEVSILEFLRRISKKFNKFSIAWLSSSILKGRWGSKVVPLNRNISVDTRFLPTQEILEIILRSKVVGIGWCYCRSVQRKYNAPKCDHPLYTCFHIGFGKSLYEIPGKSEKLKRISKEEIINLLNEFDDRGLIHQLIYFPSPQFYYIICNCCPCCCITMSNFLKGGSPQIIKSDFIAETDLNICKNCGECEPWCYFGARKIVNSRFRFNSINCFGCGICVTKCAHKAISLKKKE